MVTRVIVCTQWFIMMLCPKYNRFFKRSLRLRLKKCCTLLFQADMSKETRLARSERKLEITFFQNQIRNEQGFDWNFVLGNKASRHTIHNQYVLHVFLDSIYRPFARITGTFQSMFTIPETTKFAGQWIT